MGSEGEENPAAAVMEEEGHDNEVPGKDLSVFWSCVWWAPTKLATSVDQLLWWLWGGSSGSLPEPTMDTLNTLLLGWLFSALLILVLVKFLYDKFLRGSDEEEQIYASVNSSGGSNSELKDNGDKVAAAAKAKREQRRAPTIVPAAGVVAKGSAGAAAGQDVDAVRWINLVMKWLYRGPHGAVAVPYLSLLNEMTAQTALETGVLIEVLELLPSTPSPQLTNVVVDCFPNDDMHLTCDCETQLFVRLQTTRTHRDVTTESEYAGVLKPLRGRVNAVIHPQQCSVTLKFDGWPEVEMELEGIRNNEEGLGEKELQEVIKEVVAGAIRSMVLEINLKEDASFPRFKRARELPEKVIPVGYDSMVRERQTHPPVLKPRVPEKPRDIPTVSLKDNRYLQQNLSHNAAISSSNNATTFNNNLLTQNVSAVLSISEEQLIARNISQYDHDVVVYDDDDDSEVIEYHNKLEDFAPLRKEKVPWEDDYIPDNFLEAVTAVAIAKVEQKTLAEPKHDQHFLLMGSTRQKSLDEPKDNVVPAAFDYIPYDSEYEEDDDADDYLEKQFTPDKKLPAPLAHRDEVYIPTESDVKNMINKVTEVFSSKPMSPSQTKGIDALPIAATSLGAMGLPHHPKSHFVTSMAVSQHSPPTLPAAAPAGALSGRRLLVKIVKATGIGCDKSPVNSYVVVEMDEPNQKFTTATAKGTNSPFWDEQFLFDLSDITLELLFELYDETDSSFLGLGIVGIEELIATPSQRQIIPLQARPYEDDAVSGTLTVEFLFLSGGDLPDLTVRCSNVQQSRSLLGDLVTTTTTTTHAKTAPPEGVVINGRNSVTKSVLRDIESSLPTTTPAKSIVIIHSSKKPEEEPEYFEDQDGEAEDSDEGNYVVNTLQYPFSPAAAAASPSNTDTPSNRHTVSANVTTAAVTSTATTSSSNANNEDERGRSRDKRKRDSFLGNLKKRFSRSKVRSQSVEPTAKQPVRERSNDAPRTATVGRSVSMERSSKLRPADKENRKSVPLPHSAEEHATTEGDLQHTMKAASRRNVWWLGWWSVHNKQPFYTTSSKLLSSLLSVPKSESRGVGGRNSGGETGSTRSSLSETSGLSSSSTRTYVNEASMLIVETVENGVVKHYLVPVTLQQRNRWRKRGTKLHVYSGHTFVAKHISSSLLCSVCEKHFNKRPGKQGYECRDCGQRTHKPCHVKTEIQCPRSTVNNMDLVYIKDPREERRLQKNQRFHD